MSNYPTFVARIGAARISVETLREWQVESPDAVCVVFPTYPLSEPTDIDVLNDTVDEIVYPASLVDLTYEIDLAHTMEAWNEGGEHNEGVLWVRATGAVDWEDLEDSL